ncbi:MAG: hypothetical protein Kapaf2KO_11780 [Candidatus Kapaibacteriales bacterium]
MNNDIAIKKELVKVIDKAKGKVSSADLSAETGYSLDIVNSSLSQLIEQYKSKIAMNRENGEVVYSFNFPLERREKKSFREYFHDFTEALWKVYKKIYTVAIGVVLIAYTVIFTIILLALILKGGGNDDDSDSSFSGTHLLSSIFRVLGDYIFFRTIDRGYNYQQDNSDYRYKRTKEDPNKGKNFIYSIFSFVFGPERKEFDPLNDDKEVVAFIRKNSYKITAAKIIELTGVNYEEADLRLAKYIAKFDGEAYIDTNGVLIVEFPRLEHKVSSDLRGGEIEYYKDEVEPPYELTGNSNSRNMAIIVLNTFNLIMSIVVLSSLSDFTIAGTSLEGNSLITIIIGYFPLVFSILFFLTPLFRYFRIERKQKQRQKIIVRKVLIGNISAIDSYEFEERNFINNYPQYNNEYALSILRELNLELSGELILDNNGNAIHRFDRYISELKAL